jgi:hypothetical protein
MRNFSSSFGTSIAFAESGTGHIKARYPGDLQSRNQPAFLKIRPLLIGLKETGRRATFKIKKSKQLGGW